MDKANVIISIIIVLCIAAAVAAYGLTNNDNPIFSGLSSMSSRTGSGIGNNSTAHHNGTGTSVATTNGGSSGAGSSGSGGGAGSGSGSGAGSGSSSGGSGGSGGGSGSGTHLSYSQAQSIANGAIGIAGAYASNGYYSGGYWYFTIYDANGNNVDTISVDDATGATGRG